MGPVSLFDILVIGLLLGWPGLIVGAGAGWIIGKAHRIPLALALALAGLPLCILVRLLPW